MGTRNVNIQTNHTGCAAVAVGYGGYNSSPTSSDTGLVACTSGSGTAGGWVSLGTPSHGAVYDPNQSTGDYIYEAHIGYGY